MEMNDLEHIGESVEAEPQAAVNRDEEAEDIRHYEANEELIIGMEFNSIDEAFSQYKAFAFRCGFGIMRSGRRFTPDGATEEVSCICKSFEFRGILCRHALCILRSEFVTEMPEKYIVNRWRKDFKRIHSLAITENPRSIVSLPMKYDNLYNLGLRTVQEIVEMVSSFSNASIFVATLFEELKAKTANHISTLIDASLPYQPNSTAQSTNRASNIINNENVLDPIVAQAKGRPKSKRKVSGCEIAVNKIKNKTRKTKKQHESSTPSSTPPSQPRSSQIREQSHQLDEEFETWMASQL
ncbi:Protein FAR1-RELATED SEQUENCE 6 [Acorus calamus]|uniref:Protein FAR1-RELATED SEQUENCE 6 n=1 Tax=Acorus calamus TaxID=4465 RepID=A0AAV9EYE6_ACOCL|nr:Protein FAR1-RELATED SEQUENCE 6 [Acorus calamus]